MSQLDDIKARAEKATPGPWNEFDAQIRHTQIDGWIDPVGRAKAQAQTASDIEFVMHARTDVPKLVAALEAVQKYAESAEPFVLFGGARASGIVQADTVLGIISEALR